MDRDVDSLEHIMALVTDPNDLQRNNNRNQPQQFEEPSYRILPRSENHASSFGAGGTISQVIDPDFRTPTTHVFGQMLDSATTMTSNIMSSTLLDYGPPVTVSSQNNRIIGLGGPPPPPPPPQPHPSPQPHHVNPFLVGGHRPTFHISTTNEPAIKSSANEPFRPPYVSPAPQVQSSYNQPRNSVPQPISKTMAPSTRPPPQVPEMRQHPNPVISTSQAQTIFIPSTSQFIRPPGSTYVAPTFNGPLYSPKPKNPSPPLDQIIINPPNIGFNIQSSSNSNNVSNSKTSTPANMQTNSKPNTDNSSSNKHNERPAAASDTIGKIPKKKSNVSDKFDEMSMLVLQETYRKYEARLDDNKRERQKIERALNDMARNSHGKNIELDPSFRQKKDDQRRCDDTALDIRSKMKKISEKLSTKFQHKIVPNPGKSATITSKRAPPKRARMSTSGATRSDSPTESLPHGKDKMRLMFDMCESKMWCKLCDIHLDSLQKYCDHLHSRDHLRNTKRSDLPWRKTKSKIDKRKTYDMVKSICARVSNEVDSTFSLAKLNKIVAYAGSDEATLKEISLERERGRFDPDDPLLHVKGYQNLIPISGFFCQLCDRSYCDITTIEQHLKGYEHNYRHAISVANDEISEMTFKELREKSYKKQFPDHKSSTSNRAAPISSEKARTSKELSSSASNNSRANLTNAPVTQYKKLTSHIVDEHEAVIQKFPAGTLPEKRAISKPTSDRPATVTSKSRRILESDESDDDNSPHIVVSPSKSAETRQDVAAATTTKTFVKNRMPEIVPLQESRSRPSALKRLKQREPPVKKPHERPLSSSSDTSEEIESSPLTHDLCAGDPNSPFPDLDITVTANVHRDSLRDVRLRQPCVVRMNRINVDDYKEMLMEKGTLWSRITHLMTKREEDALNNLSKRVRDRPSTRPTYFTASGSTVPIDLDDETSQKFLLSDDSEVEEKPKLPLNGSKASEMNENKNKKSLEEENDSDNRDDNIDVETGANKPKEKFQMGWLENFFCEK